MHACRGTVPLFPDHLGGKRLSNSTLQTGFVGDGGASGVEIVVDKQDCQERQVPSLPSIAARPQPEQGGNQQAHSKRDKHLEPGTIKKPQRQILPAG